MYVWQTLGTLRIYDGVGEEDAWLKMCFYFTLEFRIYLELSSVSVDIKTCPRWICYECVQFPIEIWKLSRCGSRSPDNAELGHFMLLFSEDSKDWCTKNYNARVQPLLRSLNLLFGDVNSRCRCRRVLRKVLVKRTQTALSTQHKWSYETNSQAPCSLVKDCISGNVHC